MGEGRSGERTSFLPPPRATAVGGDKSVCPRVTKGQRLLTPASDTQSKALCSLVHGSWSRRWRGVGGWGVC